MTRSYWIHVPPAAASGQPLAMVMNLHGDTQNGQLEELQTQMDTNADQNGYLAVYPNGTRVSKVLTPDPVAKNAQYGWNAGECCALPQQKKVDDVDFLLKVISDVASRTPVDLRRVYVTGISSGGMMANALAAQAADHSPPSPRSKVRSRSRPFTPRGRPRPEFASVTDPIVPYNGTPNKNPKLVLSAQDGVDQWVHNDHCATTPHVSAPLIGAAGSVSAGETATLVTYTSCQGGAQVDMWRLSGSGHVWPGSALNTGPKNTWILGGVGRGTVLIDANEINWNFFKQYQLAKDPS